MCSSYIINGERVETGRDLVAAIGIKAARRVNANFSPDKISEPDWLNCCLCHVNRAVLWQITGKEYKYDADQDAFIPA